MEECVDLESFVVIERECGGNLVKDQREKGCDDEFGDEVKKERKIVFVIVGVGVRLKKIEGLFG